MIYKEVEKDFSFFEVLNLLDLKISMDLVLLGKEAQYCERLYGNVG